MASIKAKHPSPLIDQIVGHEEQKQSLLHNIRNGQLASAFIFHGPGGVGKKKLVRAFLQVANCQETELACGRCSPCVRSLEEKNEFIHEINLQSKKNISVDQVRELRYQLSLKPLHPVRFVIIDPADCLSGAAANALLKVLEETPERTHFFLLTDRLGSLLLTIRSRCHKVPLTCLSREELLQIQDFGTKALDWSRGRVDQAIFLEEAESQEKINQSLELFRSLLCGEPRDWKKEAPWFFTKNGEQEFCLNLWNQALQRRLHGEDKDISWLPPTPKTISFIFECLQDLEKDLWSNVDKLLALENFYYSCHTASPHFTV